MFVCTDRWRRMTAATVVLLFALAGGALAQFTESLTNLDGVAFDNCRFVLLESDTRPIKLFWCGARQRARARAPPCRSTGRCAQVEEWCDAARQRASASGRRRRLRGGQ